MGEVVVAAGVQAEDSRLQRLQHALPQRGQLLAPRLDPPQLHGPLRLLRDPEAVLRGLPHVPQVALPLVKSRKAVLVPAGSRRVKALPLRSVPAEQGLTCPAVVRRQAS